ncbi:MAG TPA: sigma-70 family RNA polymerase sigma factor [Opitutaceae bacterium]
MVEANGQSGSFLPFDAAALARHRDLIVRVAAGDAEALQLLYLELGPVVNGIVRRILENPEDARETVQDTFIRVWRSAGTFRAERGEVVAWIIFIARNAAVSRVRKGARQRVLYEALQREAAEPFFPPVYRFDVQEDVSRRLDTLSAAQRRALELAFFGGFTQAQIAAAMQTPIGNVKNYLRRGLQKLRQLARSHD